MYIQKESMNKVNKKYTESLLKVYRKCAEKV